MKKILLIAYHFPPDAAMGAVRPAKFVRYLPQFGWEPIILTVKDKYFGVLDQTLADANSTLPMVVRTGMLRHPSYYYRKLKRMFRMDRGNSDVSGCFSLWQLKNARHAFNSLLSFPDEQAGWLPFAVIRGMKVIRQEGVGILMTSGPPHSVHLIGACLSKLARIPWIADFRDPWLDSCLNQREVQSSSSQKLERRVEAWVISQAALIMTTTKQFTDRLGSRFPEYREKIITIPNGYDPDEFSKIRRGKEKHFTISYTGSIYHRRNPEPVLHAISELIKGNYMDPNRVVIRFIGPYNEGARKVANLLIARYGLTGIVEVLPWLPRHHALEMMMRSHVLLLLAEDQPLQIPGKVYDYLGAGSDILAITENGATADLLREVGTGVVISPGDHQTVKSKIKALYIQYLASNQHDNDNCFVRNILPIKYSRRYLTQELARFLEKVNHIHTNGNQ